VLETIKKLLQKLNFVRFIRDFKVIVKLYAGFSVLLVLMLAINIYSISVQQDLSNANRLMYEEQLKNSQRILTLSADFQDLNASVASALLMSTSDAEQYLTVIIGKHDQIVEHIEGLSDFADSKSLQVIKQIWNNYKADFDDVVDMILLKDSTIGRVTAKEAAISTYNRQMKSKIDGLTMEMNRWSQEMLAEAEQIYLENERKNKNSAYITYAIMIIAVVLTVLIGKVVADLIVKPLNTLVQAAEQMAKGKMNFRIPVNRKDELGRLADTFNAMNKSTGTLITNVRDMAFKVQHSMEELAQGSEQTATSSATITESVQQIADRSEKQKQLAVASGETVEKLTEQILHVTSISSKVLEVSQHANDQALQGHRTVQTAVEQMNEVQSAMNETMAVVKELTERMKEIDKMANVISEISRQTQLLSLNAAIEAARAGEHGRGFAVVAEEVKKLSEVSGESSRQITKLLEAIQQDVQHAIRVSVKGNEEVVRGVESVGVAGQSFQAIVEQMDHVTAQNEHLHQLAQQMAESTGTMLESIRSIVELSKESADNTSNAAAATEEQVATVEQFVALVQSVNKLSNDLLDSLKVFEVADQRAEQGA
jgi:methyl-accepting chemotaxis protein